MTGHEGNGRRTAAVRMGAGGARVLSLDILRGLSILLMLLVNNLAEAPQTVSQLRHAEWGSGIHLADLAFPWFLLCVGVAIPFSAAGFARRGESKRQFYLRILRRTAILLALGAILDMSWDHKLVFFTVGVLQTIAISYALAALLYNLAGRWRLLVAGVCLVGYWAAIKLLPIPGVGAGVFTEDRNLILYLNRTYLGHVGLWNLPRIVPTTALTLIGTAVGDLLRREYTDPRRKSAALALLGVVFVAGGYIWSLSLPFNKPVWTPSYVLLAAGLGTLLLGLVYLVVDIWRWRWWAFPLIVFGSNAVLAYVVPILVKTLILNPLDVSIVQWFRLTSFVVFWWLVLWLLHRKKIFLRV